jgi:hypothetical protein
VLLMQIPSIHGRDSVGLGTGFPLLAARRPTIHPRSDHRSAWLSNSWQLILNSAAIQPLVTQSTKSFL